MALVEVRIKSRGTKGEIPIKDCTKIEPVFKTLLDSRSVDVVQPDVAASGGITEMKKIAGLAHLYGVQTVPHSWGTGIAIHGLTTHTSFPQPIIVQ